MESLESRQLFSATPLSFHVVDDAATNRDYRYAASGAAQGSTALVAANAAPRGAASTIGVDQTWVIDANRNVYVYNAGGNLLGSWSAGSLANNAAPEGIATDGNDVWILDAKSDKVFRYAGAATRTSGSQAAASSFSLNSGNSNPKDLVTDGYSLWVVDDGSKTDKVFKYSTAGALVGSWTTDSSNKAPTGLALDPANVGDLWISDSGSDRVYKYAGAAGRHAGSQSAVSSFALASGNGNAQGLVVAGRPWAEAPPSVEWVRQFGGAGDDLGLGVAADGAGNVVWSGQTRDGANAVPLLASYDAAGAPQWSVQQPAVPGTNYTGVRVATDAAGNVFQVEHGATHLELSSYDSLGVPRWSTPLPAGEGAYGVAVDSLGNAYMATAGASGIVVRKFHGSSGAVTWLQTLNVGPGWYASGIDVDPSGSVYVSGYTSGAVIGPNAGGVDSFVAKFTDTGALVWARQFGSAGTDFAWDVAADALGNVYVVGQTNGSLAATNVGENDLFVSKYDASGAVQWTRQLGSSGDESLNGVWADPAGNVYAAGWTRAALGGPGAGGLADGMIVKFDTAGEQLWTMQLGSMDRDALNDVFGDADGNIYLAGNTRGSWGGSSTGGADGVLVKLSAPAPAAVVAGDEPLAALTALAPQSVNLGANGKPSAPRPPAMAAHDAAPATLPGARSFAPPRHAALNTAGRPSLGASDAKPTDLSAALDAALASLL